MNLRNTITTLVLVALLAGSAVTGAAATTTAGNAATTSNPAVQSPNLFKNDANSTVTPDTYMYEVKKGKTVTMNFSLKDADAITVQLGGGQKKYKLNASVMDSNGDGKVTLTFDTSKAGSGDGSALSIKGDDKVTVKNETKVKLSPDTYGITIYAGTGKSVPKIGYAGLEVTSDSKSTSTRETSTSSSNTTSSSSSSDMTSTTMNDSTTTTSSGSSGQPGFGLGVSVVALAAVALLARRR